MTARRIGLRIIILATALGWPRPAAAADAERAEALFQEARKLLEQDDYDVACGKLEESQRLDPGAGTLALLAYCHEMQGRTATAYEEYGRAAKLARERRDPERAETVEKQRDRMLPKLSSLRLVVAHPVSGLSIRQNGKTIAQSEWNKPVLVDPGTVSVEARAPGRIGWTANVSVAGEGARVDVDIPELQRDAQPNPRASTSDTPIWIAIGVGMVGVGVGSYFGLRAKSLNDESNEGHCNGNVCDDLGFDKRKDAQKAATFATVGFAVGAAGLATGAVLWIIRPRGEAARAVSGLRVSTGPKSSFVGYQQSF